MALCRKDEILGYKPIPARWNVVRGDTAILTIEFLENDEVTQFDTTGWEFEATAFNPRSQQFDELDVDFTDGILTVTAAPDLTEGWGTGMGTVVSELRFDVQVSMPDDTVWTPILGTIVVASDVTGGIL